MSDKTARERAEWCREELMADRVSDGAYIGDAILAGVAALERIADCLEGRRVRKDGGMGVVVNGQFHSDEEPDPTGYPPTKRVWATFDAVRYALGAMVREHRMTTKRGDFFHVDYAEDALAAYDAAMKEE